MLASDKQVQSLVDIFKSGTRLSYKKSEYIIRPGETPGGVFYIESGIVKAYNITKYGEENLLIIRKEHEIFPLIWAITGQERHIIYQTLTPAVVWRVHEDVYRDYLKRHTTALPPLLDMVTEMYRVHSERILTLEYRTVRERLISYLIYTSQRFGKVTPEGTVLEVPLRHQDIAGAINSSRETTSRELAYLDRKGLIASENSHIILKDIPALEAHL